MYEFTKSVVNPLKIKIFDVSPRATTAFVIIPNITPTHVKIEAANFASLPSIDYYLMLLLVFSLNDFAYKNFKKYLTFAGFFQILSIF